MRKLLSVAAALAGQAIVSPDQRAIDREPQGGFGAPRIRTSKRYPEQSSRQEMRAFRRQQGGPGIVLDTKINQYVPRD